MKLSTNSNALAKEGPERTKLNVVSGQFVLGNQYLHTHARPISLHKHSIQISYRYLGRPEIPLFV